MSKITVTGQLTLTGGQLTAKATAVAPTTYALWSWGRNNVGYLGLGDVVYRSSPVQVGLLSDWTINIGNSAHVMAIKNDGTLWGWGNGAIGRLGLENTTNYSSPVQVGALSNWAKIGIGVGLANAHAIKTDGTLWSWGFNTVGQLGDGTAITKSSPVQIGSLTNWAIVTGGLSKAIKTDGTLWTWGSNTNGQLGLGDTVNRSSPVQVGAFTDWASINRIHAIKTDGTLWAFGLNNSGQLGLGDTNNRSSPVQVGVLTNWTSISNDGSSSLAVKNDGSLWAWGLNGSSGRLGLEDILDRSSPAQVGSLTNWASASVSSASFAVKTDGTLWSWGENGNGQLGLGDAGETDRSSPVQIGTDITWISVQSAGIFVHAIKTV